MRPRSLILVTVCLFSMGLLAAGCGASGSSKEGQDSQSVAATTLSRRGSIIPRRPHVAAGKAKPLAPVRWRVVGAPEGREVEIRSDRGYCVDREPAPEFEKVSVAYRDGAAYITAFVPAKRSAAKGTICDGIGYAQYGVVKLSSSVKTLRLFDASTNPPMPRSPRSD